MNDKEKCECKSLQNAENKLLQLLQENEDVVENLPATQDGGLLSLEQIAKMTESKWFTSLQNVIPHIKNFVDERNKGDSVFCVSRKTMERIKKEGLQFIKNSGKDGLSPVLRNKSKKIVAHADLEELFLPMGDPSMAIAMGALASQLAQIQEMIRDVQESIDDVYKGQWNDRIAKIDAAKKELQLSMNIENIERKNQIISNALCLACSGECEIILSLKDEINKCENLSILCSTKKAKKTMNSLIGHIPTLFESWQIKLLLLQESKEIPALAAEANRIRNEIQTIFTKERLELLQGQTHGNKNYWTETFKSKIASSENVLISIEKQSNEIINYKKEQLLSQENLV